MSSALERLEEHMETNITSEFTEKERFSIQNTEQANWALRKLAKLEKEKTEVEKLAEQEIAKIQAWKDGENERIEREAEYFRNLLIEYHRHLLEQDPKKKTLKLPHGQLKCRAQQPQWHWNDEELLDWLRENKPDLVKEKVIYSPDKNSIKKTVQVVEGQAIDPDTGEVVPGVVVEERGLKFVVEVV